MTVIYGLTHTDVLTQRKSAVKKIILLLISLAPLLLFVGAVQVGSGGKYTEIKAQGSVPVFRQDAEEWDIVVLGENSRYIRLNPDGTEKLSINLNSRTKQAKLWGFSLYAYSAVNNKILFTEYSTEDGSVTQNSYIPVNFSDVDLITADGLGKTYVHRISKPSAVSVYDCYGAELQSVEFNSDVLFMDIFDDELIVFSGGSLKFFDVTGELTTAEREISCGVYPAEFLSPSVFTDNVGDVYSIGPGDEIELLCKTGVVPEMSATPLKLASLHCADENGYIYSGGAEDGCKVFDSLGNLLTVYSTEGKLRGVSSGGIITDRDGVLYFSPYSSFKITEEPSNPSDYPEDWEIFENYLIVPQGTTIAKLKSQYDCTVTFGGVEENSGICRSEMILTSGTNQLTVIVMGDLNSSGTVNTEDVKLLQKWLVSKTNFSEAIEFAADISGKGLIDTTDLVLMALSVR